MVAPNQLPQHAQRVKAFVADAYEFFLTDGQIQADRQDLVETAHLVLESIADHAFHGEWSKGATRFLTLAGELAALMICERRSTPPYGMIRNFSELLYFEATNPWSTLPPDQFELDQQRADLTMILACVAETRGIPPEPKPKTKL